MEEVEEEEDYSLSGQQGQTVATSTPVGGFQNTVPKSFSTEPPSYRVVTPPTPKHNSVRFADQHPSSLEPPQRPPLPHQFVEQYDAPLPMVALRRAPLNTSNLEVKKSYSPPKTFGPAFPFHSSRYAHNQLSDRTLDIYRLKLGSNVTGETWNG